MKHGKLTDDQLQLKRSTMILFRLLKRAQAAPATQSSSCENAKARRPRQADTVGGHLGGLKMTGFMYKECMRHFQCLGMV